MGVGKSRSRLVSECAKVSWAIFALPKEPEVARDSMRAAFPCNSMWTETADELSCFKKNLKN